MAIPIRAQFSNPEGTRVKVEYDNGTISDFPANVEANFPPWTEVLGMVASGRLALEVHGKGPPILAPGQYISEDKGPPFEPPKPPVKKVKKG